MIDRVGPDHELWRLFEERRRALGFPAVQCLSADILALADASPCPQFDVVHCSGVLYHMPDPMRLLVALRKITRESLVLSSVVTATRVASDQGVLEIPKAAALFVFALQKQERAILHSYWRRFVGNEAIGLTSETASWCLDDYVPWWWLPTVEAFKAMSAAVGFHFQRGAYFWNNNAYVQLLSTQTWQDSLR